MLTLIVFLYLLVGAVSVVLHFRYFGVYLYNYEDAEPLSWVIFKSMLVYLFWPITWLCLLLVELGPPEANMNIFANLRKCDKCFKEYTARLDKLETEVAASELTDAVVDFFKYMR